MDLLRDLDALQQPLLSAHPWLLALAVLAVVLVCWVGMTLTLMGSQSATGGPETMVWGVIAIALLAGAGALLDRDPSSDERLEVFASYLAEEHDLIVVKDATFHRGDRRSDPSYTATAVTPDGDFTAVTVTWLDLDPNAPDLPATTEVVTVKTTPTDPANN